MKINVYIPTYRNININFDVFNNNIDVKNSLYGE